MDKGKVKALCLKSTSLHGNYLFPAKDKNRNSYSNQVHLDNNRLRLQLHGAICHPDSFVLMLRYCANLKAIRYESTILSRIVADKSHHVIVA